MALMTKVLGLPLSVGCSFKVRCKDMKKLLLSTRGKVFTLQNVEAEFRTR
jgi:hypothetical protein